MALYSVWDWNKNLYRVYSDNRPVSVGVDPNPPKPADVHILGAVPFDAAKVIPSGTRFMGLSHVPRGEIVREPGSALEKLGLGFDGEGKTAVPAIKYALLGALGGYLLARWMR